MKSKSLSMKSSSTIDAKITKVKHYSDYEIYVCTISKIRSPTSYNVHVYNSVAKSVKVTHKILYSQIFHG